MTFFTETECKRKFKKKLLRRGIQVYFVFLRALYFHVLNILSLVPCVTFINLILRLAVAAVAYI